MDLFHFNLVSPVSIIKTFIEISSLIFNKNKFSAKLELCSVIRAIKYDGNECFHFIII